MASSLRRLASLACRLHGGVGGASAGSLTTRAGGAWSSSSAGHWAGATTWARAAGTLVERSLAAGAAFARAPKGEGWHCLTHVRHRSNHRFRKFGSTFRHPRNQQRQKPKQYRVRIPTAVRMRFKVTGTGRIFRWRAGFRHRRARKSKAQKKRLKKTVEVSKNSMTYRYLIKIGFHKRFRGRPR